MPMYILRSSDGDILQAADWAFPDSEPVEFDVVRGLDGKLYKAGDEPAPTKAELLASLRAKRGQRIAATDYLLMPDYPLTDDAKAVVSTYRQALRDLPQQPGAPWDGGGEDTPWPDKPMIISAE